MSGNDEEQDSLGRPPHFWDNFREILKSEEMFKMASERPTTYEEFYYLLSRYAFLDIHHPDGFKPMGGRLPIRTIKAKSGWIIQDYGDRICVSAGRLMYGPYLGKDGVEVKSIGTMTQQMADTASEVIAIAISHGWPAAQVYSGFYGMIRAAWIAADSQKFQLIGFEPSASDEVVKNWVQQLLSKKMEAIEKLKMKR
jgi:hypothetical protein